MRLVPQGCVYEMSRDAYDKRCGERTRCGMKPRPRTRWHARARRRARPAWTRRPLTRAHTHTGSTSVDTQTHTHTHTHATRVDATSRRSRAGGGRRRQITTQVSAWAALKRDGVPSARYLGIIEEGAREVKISRVRRRIIKATAREPVRIPPRRRRRARRRVADALSAQPEPPARPTTERGEPC